MRKLSALVVASGLLVSLAACASSPTRESCGPSATEGDASALITAEGALGGESTTADFPTPLIATQPQVSVLEEGDGPLVERGDYVDFIVTTYNGADGELVAPSSSARFQASDASDTSVIFECVTVGSRIAATVPVGEDLTAVYIIDVEDRILGKADGASQLPAPGLPTVVTAPDGTPGITIPKEEPPTSVRSAVLKRGDGETVEEGDVVVLNYSGFVWGSPGSRFDTTWGEGAAPQTFMVGEYDEQSGTGLFPGTASAVIGQPVGSQVLVVVPPEDSFPATESAPAPDGVDADSTRIYVIDILAVQ